MIYWLECPIPANTTKENPFILEQSIPNGVIYKLIVYFPRGCAGLSGVAIYNEDFQLYPTNRGGWFIGEDVIYQFDDTYIFDFASKMIKIRAYNLSTLYEHKVMIGIGVASEEEYAARYLPLAANKDIVNAILELAKTVSASNVRSYDVNAIDIFGS